MMWASGEEVGYREAYELDLDYISMYIDKQNQELKDLIDGEMSIVEGNEDIFRYACYNIALNEVFDRVYYEYVDVLLSENSSEPYVNPTPTADIVLDYIHEIDEILANTNLSGGVRRVFEYQRDALKILAKRS